LREKSTYGVLESRIVIATQIGVPVSLRFSQN